MSKATFTFGRFNVPTESGHGKLISAVQSHAEESGGKHYIFPSHSQDSKKNPLSHGEKVGFMRRLFPDANIVSTGRVRTAIDAAKHLEKQGHTHVTMVVGSDRVREFHGLLNKYRKKEFPGIKKIEVKSAGNRDPDAEGAEGMSASKMREHAKSGDFNSFKQGVPSHVPEKHAKELFRDVRKGMGINENYNRGLFRAIFVTGGPGSGKDIIIREAIPETKAVELNSVQAFEYLMDKQKLSEKTNDHRREAIRNRGPLIINGPADDHTRILTIKEELEELGYSTTMVFVDTTNEASKERNERLTKTLAESIRYDKWKLAQTSKQAYIQNFQNFMEFNNSTTLDEIEEDISDTYEKINTFIENRKFNEIAFSWLENHGKYNITDSVFKEDENVKKNFRFVENYKTKRTGTGQASTGHPKVSAGTGPSADGPSDITPDNRAGDSNADNIKWDRNAKRGGYTFRTYTEDSGPTVKVYPAPKESNFSKDKEKIKKKGLVDSPTVSQRMRNVSGISQEFDTRQQGTVYPMSGLGDVTYREQVDFKRFRESFNDPSDSEMGVAGVLGGSTNKEPMENPNDKMGYFNKKKKK